MKSIFILLLLGSCNFKCKFESRNNPQDACGPCTPTTLGGTLVTACDCKEKK